MTTALAIVRKELRQIARDRRTLAILLVIPALLLVLYGYALNFDVRHVRLAVQDRDGSVESRRVVSAFVNSGYFDYTVRVEATADLERLFGVGAVRAALVVPEGFGRRVRTNDAPTVQVIVDGDNANTAATVVGYALRIVRAMPEAWAAAPPGGVRTAVVAEPRIWYNAELRSALFLVPGLIAYIAMITAVVSTALSIVREKESGTMEQVRMAPVSAPAFILGKSLPYLLFSLVSALSIVLVSMALFGLPMRGSWGALVLAIALFLFGALGTGLFVSTVAETQQVAFQMSVLIAYLPTLMLSGFIFPISSMPRALQLISLVVPARYFLVALRGIVLKGATLEVLVWPLVALAAYAAAILTLASVRFARQTR
jgi:ABC-2 type transport system permease protein